MIYGLDFVYVPKDNSRGIEEEFSVKPVHLIPWGDPGLKSGAGRLDEGKYFAEISYRLTESQLPWVYSWETNIYPELISIGEGPLTAGPAGKITAIENSVRQALRDYLRPRIYDKPGRISGSARLSGVPVFSLDAGKYLCKAKITLKIDEIRQYGLF